MQVSWVVELSKDYAAKREQLKRPAGAIKDALVSIVWSFAAATNCYCTIYGVL